MKKLDPMMYLVVFQEMLGPLLWVLVALAVLGLGAFIFVLVRERRIVSTRLVRSELIGLVGGVLSLVLMAKVSSSGFTDAGGPADWFLIALVFGVGLAGVTILTYAVVGVFAIRARRRDESNPALPGDMNFQGE